MGNKDLCWIRQEFGGEEDNLHAVHPQDACLNAIVSQDRNAYQSLGVHPLV